MAEAPPTFRPPATDDSLHLHPDSNNIGRPVKWVSPTSVHLDLQPTPAPENPPELGSATQANVKYEWTSRNNRKGRHAILTSPATDNTQLIVATPPPTSRPSEILKGITRMLTCFPVYDISWLVAISFTIGSVIWVINSFFAFLPLIYASTEFEGESYYGGGVTAFIGATVFEIGGILLVLESINQNQESCFGWAVEHIFDSDKTVDGTDANKAPSYRVRAATETCLHHHADKSALLPLRKPTIASRRQPIFFSTLTPDSTYPWKWTVSWKDLCTHYLRDIGFLACITVAIGATIFWISGFTALPGIYNQLSTPEKMNGAYWIPQVVGSVFFVISGALFMVETQERWWKPAPRTLGWHVGVWNLIGGVGFLLCAVFGLTTATWGPFQASCSTFWGSWAFLIGSVVQWYESLSKYPVEEAKA